MGNDTGKLTRRNLLQGAAAGAAALAAPAFGCALAAAEAEGPVIKNGRIKQSLVNWCYRPHWKDADELCRVAKSLGCSSVELMPLADWPALKRHGLTCAITNSHGFEKGVNNPEHQPAALAKMREMIDLAAEAGHPSVITFTGFADGISLEDGKKNCIEAYKKIVGHAEAKGVTLCLEMLNSRVDEAMKGHPGYQGDHTDYCMEILRAVSSPRLKLLFDIYHVQIMDGDVIRRVHECGEYIGHVHTAGNPGRAELDKKQELYYPPIMEALLEIGYKGFVGQEFIPTRDPLEGLKEAVALCDV